MNPVFKKMLNENGVKFNKDVMEGLARKDMENVVEQIDLIIKSAIRTLPPEVGMTYNGWSRLTPRESFYNDVERSSIKDLIDITRSSLFKIRLGFTYNGNEYNRVLALPYVDRGSILTLSNTSYVITPVLSEFPVSPVPGGEVFIRLLRDKLTVKSMKRNFYINGEKTGLKILYSKVYKLLKEANDNIPLVLYLAIKYGFNGMFEKYCGTIPKVVVGEVSEEDKEKYDIYETIGTKPRRMEIGKNDNYVKHDIKILVEKGKRDSIVDLFVAGIMYSFDFTPVFSYNIVNVIGKKKMGSERLTYENVDDETLAWIFILGKIVFKNKSYTSALLFERMFEHIDVLNDYIDDVIDKKLKEMGIIIDDFFDLLGWVMTHFHSLTVMQEGYSSELSNRYIEVLYYILFDILVGINKVFLEFKRSFMNKKVLTEKEVNKKFNSHLTTKKIFSLIKSSGINIAIAPIDSTTDNLYFKITSILEDQNRGNGVKKSKRNTLPSNTKTLHAEDLAFGSMLFLIKKYPSPRFRINPFVRVDSKTDRLYFDKDVELIVRDLDKKLSNKFEDDNIAEKDILKDDELTEIEKDVE